MLVTTLLTELMGYHIQMKSFLLHVTFLALSVVVFLNTPLAAHAQLTGNETECALGIESINCDRKYDSDQRTSLSLDTSIDGWREAMLKFIYLVNYYLIPLLLAVALVAFLWNVFRYAIASNNEKSREIAKRYMIYSITAFVVIVSFWGIINLFINGLGLGQSEAPCNDFFTDYAGVNTPDCL